MREYFSEKGAHSVKEFIYYFGSVTTFFSRINQAIQRDLKIVE